MVCYYELLHNKNYGPLKLFSQDVTELLGDHLIGRPHGSSGINGPSLIMHALEWAWPGESRANVGGVVTAFVNNHVWRRSEVFCTGGGFYKSRCIDGRSLTQDTEQQYHHRY